MVEIMERVMKWLIRCVAICMAIAMPIVFGLQMASHQIDPICGSFGIVIFLIWAFLLWIFSDFHWPHPFV